MATAIHIELNALSLLILSVIAYQSVHSVNQQMKRVLFRDLVFGIGAALALDIVWLLVEGRQFPGAIFINRVVNALYLAAGVVLGCIWYMYVLETLGYNLTPRLQTVIMIPAVFFTLLNLISIGTEWVFTVSPENVYSHGRLFWLQMIGAYGMLLVSLAHIVVRLINRDSRVPRRTVLKLLGFYAPPVIGALVSIPYTGMPGAWTCAAISAVLMYIDEQDSEILRDGLTGLNNRKVLESVYADYARQTSAERPLTLFMIDLDNFKLINDTLGHPVGDEALVAAAEILTGAMAGVKGIVARYGGDEFLILGFISGAPEAFRDALRARFAAYNREHRLRYRLAASIGIGQYESGMTLNALMERADGDLYIDKKKRNAGR